MKKAENGPFGKNLFPSTALHHRCSLTRNKQVKYESPTSHIDNNDAGGMKKVLRTFVLGN